MKRFFQQHASRAAQRRVFALEATLRRAREEDPNDPVQIAFAYTHVNEVDGSNLRRRISDVEYDDEH